ncbi:MAG TPA: MOSC domain-containing protein [Thermodesulfovibrionales bacterium]|nr:MOSC domain-containing protein [Thermodesulfovibrionales bacterium]
MITESLNIGLPRKERFYGREMLTGICKVPVSGPLLLKKLGFEGDGVGDTKHHGGPDKAVCVYSTDHYPYWQEIMGMKLPAAAFGENLSVANLREEDICIGDIFELGTALVQVSQPRQPCKTLAARYGRDDMIRLVVDSGYTGFYLKVLKEGLVEQGSTLILKERDPHRITVSFANQTYHHDNKNCGAIKKILEVPGLSESWQRSFQELARRCR